MYNCAWKDQVQGFHAAAIHDHTGCCKKAPLFAGQTVSVINNDSILWLPATLVYAVNHSSYIVKVVVELSTDEYETTFVDITQMLSSLTCTPRLRWLDNMSPLPQLRKLISKHPLLLQHSHLLSLQYPSKLQPKALQQQTTPSRWHLQLQMYNHQMAELLSHLTHLVMSLKHHNVLLNRCKYNCGNVTGWASAPTHNRSRSKET